jgi:hypothetical protein
MFMNNHIQPHKAKATIIAMCLYAMCLVHTPLKAQVPQGMNYQAVVRNNNGSPVGQGTAVKLRFTIHDGSTGGTPVFTEVDSTTANEFGLVTLVIGESSALSSANWGNGNAKFLQVEADVNHAGQYTDMGTTPLQSVPFALYAASSGGSGGGLTLPYVQSIGNVNNAFDITNTSGSAIVGTSAAASASGIYGYATGLGGYGLYGNATNGTGIYGSASGTNGRAVNGYASGNAKYAVFGEASSASGIAGFFASNSNISTPNLQLYENEDDFTRLSFTNSVNNNYWTIAGYTNSAATGARLNFYYNSTGDVMSLTGDGKVGIGTTAPSDKLNVTWADNTYYAISGTNTDASGLGIHGVITNTSSNTSSIGVYGENDGAGTGVFAYSAKGSAIYATVPASSTNKTAIELNNGAIKVSGTNKSAFKVVVQNTTANTLGYKDPSTGYVLLTSSLLDNDPNAMIFFTPVCDATGCASMTNSTPTQMGVIYDNTGTKKWSIYPLNATQSSHYDIPVGSAFNVLVIKQ